MKKLHLIIALLLSAVAVRAQELNCQVTINTEQVQGSTNKQIFDQMQKAVTEFINNRAWTNEVFGQQEKIECSFLIIVKDVIGSDEYGGSIQISSRRPVYKSGYASTNLNIEDEFFQFRFQQFTQLEFNINTFQNNLTSVLAYYAYVVLATDYDSFAPNGGTAYWKRAQEIVNNAQSARESGWQSSQTGQKNRYWLVENMLQPVFKGIRDCMYDYSMKGLDIMYEKPEEGRLNVIKALDLLKPVYSNRPASYIMTTFFNAKRDEIINMFKTANPEEKSKVMETLAIVDPAGTTKYQKIQER